MKKSKLLQLAAATWPNFTDGFTLIDLPPIDGDIHSITLFSFQYNATHADHQHASTQTIAIIHGAGEWERVRSFAEAFRSRHQDVFWQNYTADITHEALAPTPHYLATGQFKWRTV